MVRAIYDKWETLCIMRVNSNNNTMVDPSVFRGAGGILYSLHKYCRYLRNDDNVCQVSDYWCTREEKKLEEGLNESIYLLPLDKSHNTSFL
jgi:hypothetical protein